VVRRLDVKEHEQSRREKEKGEAESCVINTSDKKKSAEPRVRL